MSYVIEILPNNSVKISNDISEPHEIIQSHYPNGDIWESTDEAITWAEMFVEAMEIEDAPYPPAGRGQERVKKLHLQ
jgi:hypothetical protein